MISRRSFLTGISAAALVYTVAQEGDGVELESMAHPAGPESFTRLRWVSRQAYEDAWHHMPHDVIQTRGNGDYLLLNYHDNAIMLEPNNLEVIEVEVGHNPMHMITPLYRG